MRSWRGCPRILYVNNRLVGNAPNTVRAVLALVEDLIAADLKKATPTIPQKSKPPAQFDLF